MMKSDYSEYDLIKEGYVTLNGRFFHKNML